MPRRSDAFLVTVLLQVGAIYLWSYVYNIVRISSSRSSKEVEINDSSTSISSREGSISTESLLPAKAPPEQLGLPSTRFDHKTQVDYCSTSQSLILQAENKLTRKKMFAYE